MFLRVEISFATIYVCNMAFSTLFGIYKNGETDLVALLLAALAAVDATVLAPGLLNAGLLNAGLIGPSAITTGSVVSIPGAVTTDKRVIGTTGLIGASPLLLSNGLIGNGLLANGLIANGLVGAPLLNSGIISPSVSGLQESLLDLV
ncbi:hypothetical protein CEXT_59541 [Caerostris extrusa]|uniref:Uncharacterized protein n=1 Tax=Caerostris extrusa TaxID=172846 RepID=A0AAV4T0P6_CAEEX|nr:hypothetical protein CEXT_59541 [Caerostris extrusa]